MLLHHVTALYLLEWSYKSTRTVYCTVHFGLRLRLLCILTRWLPEAFQKHSFRQLISLRWNLHTVEKWFLTAPNHIQKMFAQRQLGSLLTKMVSLPIRCLQTGRNAVSRIAIKKVADDHSLFWHKLFEMAVYDYDMSILDASIASGSSST